MNLGTISFKPFSCLILVLFFTASRALANTVDVYWDSIDGFYSSSVTINQGDEVDVVNLDSSETLDLTWTDPASWYSDIPPASGGYYYYAPVVFNNPGTYYMNDQYGDYVMVTVNSTAPPPPLSVTITSPTNNAVFSAPGTFTVTAVPSGGVTPYAEVDFYVGTNHTVAYSSPYTAAVNNLSVGSYNISAVVTDNNHNTATNSIQVTVQPPPPLSVTITSPTNGAVFTAPGTFTVTAVPSGGVAPYAEVDIYVGTNHTVAYSSPYTAAVNNLSVGSYNISAIVTDNSLNTATNSIQVTVQPLTVTNYIVPVVCGNIYSSGSVDTGGYLDADNSGDQGTLEFPEFNFSQCISIQLEVNAYGEPCWSPQVNVYGFDGGNGTLSISNYNSGTLLGVLSVPQYPGYGVPLTFDVTSFVKSTKGPYFGLYLTASSGAGDLFSSLSENYGLPPELYAISPAPPPPPAIAMTGKNLVISWSTNNAFGATLQTSPTIGPGAKWVPVNLTPALVNGQWVVTNNVSGPIQFFRLSTTN